jgi:phosphoribosylamine--glycine ligase
MLVTDLLDIFEEVVDERLEDVEIRWKRVCLLCRYGERRVSHRLQKGFESSGADTIPPDITVFHAGTKRSGGKYYTNGGRVLGVTATGDTLTQAVKRAYEGVDGISFEKAHYRTDIGRK